MVVILLVMLIGMVSFAIDVGYVAAARTEMQDTADSGAHAGLSKLYASFSPTPNYTNAKAEVNRFVGGSAGNVPGLAVADADIQFGYFDPAGVVGSRFTTTLGNNQPNAVRVTLRKDGTTNPKLALFFAPVLGKADNAVQARATAWVPPGLGVLANAELIPYAAQVDYFYAAAGMTPRASNSSGFVSVSTGSFSDNWAIGAPNTMPTPGHDGVKELVLFGSTQTAPGNFGSLDLGTSSNGTPELARQLRYGPNASDFNIMKTAGKLAADGSLQSPVAMTGDTGISNGTKDDWAAIVGQNKIIPLYDTVGGNGNNASYHIVGFAGVRIVAVDMTGNPKQVWVQPTQFYSSKVTASLSGSGQSMIGVHAPPKLVIP